MNPRQMLILETITVACVAAIVAALLLFLLLRRLLPANGAALERDLAVERDRAARIPELERIVAAQSALLEAARTARAERDTALAVAHEAASRTEAAALDLRRRLVEAEAGVATSREARARADEALAGCRASLEAGAARIAALETRATALAAELAGAQEAAGLLRTDTATLRETLDAERRQAEEKIALLRAARVEMTAEFKLLAEEVMSRHGENFTKLNREQIDGVLSPLREKLGEFETRVQAAHVESTRDRATLVEQIRAIAEANTMLGREARDLTEALRGKSQLQGAWGEMVLATILERSGLRAGEEYILQRSFTGEDGDRLRPDVIVNLPGGQHVVIDSKVSLVAYSSLCDGESDEAARAICLARHLHSVRSHIAALSSKEYHAATNSGLDYVFMFVPIEGALAAAVTGDANLIHYALDRNVTLVTPTTLMIALRTVRSVWDGERRHRNADEIAERAGKLYDKFVGFVSDMSNVGDSLARTRQSWEAAMAKLTHGRGNVVRQLEQIRAMGARTGKTLPEALLLAADADPVRVGHVSGGEEEGEGSALDPPRDSRPLEPCLAEHEAKSGE